MRIFFTTLFVLVVHIISAQVRTISGTLTDNSGEPLPGVSISIKGTTEGTTTNSEGYYSIKASVGSILVFSFIGMTTQEIVVTADNLKSKGTATSENGKNKNKRKPLLRGPVPRSLFNDTISRNTAGVSVFTEQTSSFNGSTFIDPSAIQSIKKIGRTYSIKTHTNTVSRTRFGLQLTSAIGIEKVNKLPAFQNDYAQGQPMNGAFTWRGPEYQELFSWGPQIRSLEFDGSDYPYDKNGKLVAKGSGNGHAAKMYKPLSFFRTGFSAAHELIVTLPGPKSSTVVFDFENRNRNGVLPNVSYKRTNLSVNLKNFQISNDLRTNVSISYNNSNGKLLNRGGNIATVIGSVFRTPPTFDNTNTLSPRNYQQPESYKFPDGSHRSHAPAVVDNPYGLTNELPDRENLERLISSINLRYNPSSPFDINFNGNIDTQWNENTFGIPYRYSSFPEGRLAYRDEKQIFLNSCITPSYRFDTGDGDLKISASYQLQHSTRSLNRYDAQGFEDVEPGTFPQPDFSSTIGRTMARTSHEILIDGQYSFSNFFFLRLASRHYFSNTIRAKPYTNFFPIANLGVNLNEILSLWPVHELKVYASVGRTIREAPLLYSDWAYGSTISAIDRYNSHYESSELFYHPSLSPEIERKFETGLKFALNRFRTDITYYNNNTSDLIAPVRNDGQFQLQNIASVKNYGGSISAGYYSYERQVTWSLKATWSKNKSFVNELYSANEKVPLAGFTSIQTVMVPGKPLGALYGTSYLRNDNGEMIIGTDGFPLEDPTLKMIGNPIPDWTLGVSSSIDWKGLRLSALLDFKYGGDVWNGTHAYLDFLGRSSNTGSERNISNYLFEGVDVNNKPNLVTVNFVDPSKSTSENRWTRYGEDGIGEAYVEDASWIRLSELELSYTTRFHWDRKAIKQIKFTLIGHNIFLITPYTGVDPSATLFGYSAGNGIDLFNAPSTKRFSAQITLKI